MHQPPIYRSHSISEIEDRFYVEGVARGPGAGKMFWFGRYPGSCDDSPPVSNAFTLVPTTTEIVQPVADSSASAIQDESPKVEDTGTLSDKDKESSSGSFASKSPESSDSGSERESVSGYSRASTLPIGEYSDNEKETTPFDFFQCETITNGLQNSSVPVNDGEFTVERLAYAVIAVVSGVIFPVCALGFGAANIGKCHAYSLPYRVLAMGIFGLLVAAYVLFTIIREDLADLKHQQRAFKLLAFIFVILWIFVASSLFNNEFSFDSSAENYCSYGFYVFTVLLAASSMLGFLTGMTRVGLCKPRQPRRRPST